MHLSHPHEDVAPLPPTGMLSGRFRLVKTATNACG
ncbi:MAG: hypothetical protein QOE61_5796 [Micromonosporaceae bacterium]|nr:hypothetical protein [Micromonosporaceae bacterium]